METSLHEYRAMNSSADDDASEIPKGHCISVRSTSRETSKPALDGEIQIRSSTVLSKWSGDFSCQPDVNHNLRLELPLLSSILPNLALMALSKLVIFSNLIDAEDSVQHRY